MTEPVLASNIMLATMAGAMMILFGALYAFFFAWSRLKNDTTYAILAYSSYAIFAAFTVVLVQVLHLSGYWRILVALILLGYLLAPHGIWHLCVGTHPHEEEVAASSTPGKSSGLS